MGFWDKGDIFEKSVKREAPKGEYVFYDGPPFATGLPHYGHIVGSVMKDVVPRFWTMNGYRVERKWGWDCHGLPIENIVEKELGSKNKSYIEEHVGVAKFNELCRANVLSYVSDWEKIIKRLGRWADMKNSYRTMDLDYMESIWWVFKDLFDKGLIYEGYRSMHVCPRCETTLSQSEVAEGYADIKDLSAIAKFELVDEPGTFVLAWTTTPWTLIGNVALAVGKDIDYVKIREKGIVSVAPIGQAYQTSENREIYIMAKNLFAKDDQKLVRYEIVSEFKGTDLIGKRYQPLFGYYAKDQELENHANGWQIYDADFVTTTDGTGVVHIAPAFGEDDMNLGKAKNLPFIQHVAINGTFKEEVLDFPGLNVKPIGDHMSTDIEIIKYLAHHNGLFSKEKYEHSYPHCWRCDTPLINYATSSWFVNVSKIKLPMLELAQDINWSPQHIKEGRFGSWLEGARDWSISRQRFWASVMPVWRCENEGCDHQVVLGSVAKLKDLSGVQVTDLHKHVVDEVTFPCTKCGGVMHRIPDVLDTWFDSGSMPYAQMHYPFENKEKFEKNFPAEFIAEGQDQTRAWFYYQHVLATGIKQKPAFKNVIVNGIVLAEDGKKMSKKLKNYPDPSLLFDKYGSDALRYYLLTSPVMLAENLNFSEKGVLEAVRKVNMILWNVYKFYELFATDVVLEGVEQPTESQNVLDKWILARLNQLITEVTKGMHEYNLPKATRPIIEFIDDLSTWYIRRSRDRFKGDDEADAKNALATTKHVLIELAKLMAPFTPFIAEQVWQKVSGHDFGDVNQSVHLEAWSNAGQVNVTVLKEMEQVRKIVEMGLAERDKAGIKIRQPLNQLLIKNYDLRTDYENLLKDELNVENVIAEPGTENLVIELDLEITPDLKQKGIKRELVRNINSLRKNADLSIGDDAEIYYETESEVLKTVLEKFAAEIMNDTLGKAIKFGVEQVGDSKEFKIDGEMIKLGVRKI